MRRAAPWLLAGLGVLLLVAGAVLFAGADGVEEVAYGGSYEPLPADASSSTLTLTYDDAVVWTPAHLAGLALAAAGGLLLAAVGGWVLGRRGRATPPDRPVPPLTSAFPEVLGVSHRRVGAGPAGSVPIPDHAGPVPELRG